MERRERVWKKRACVGRRERVFDQRNWWSPIRSGSVLIHMEHSHKESDVLAIIHQSHLEPPGYRPYPVCIHTGYADRQRHIRYDNLCFFFFHR